MDYIKVKRIVTHEVFQLDGRAMLEFESPLPDGWRRLTIMIPGEHWHSFNFSPDDLRQFKEWATSIPEPQP